ncbi:MAG: coronin 6, isoform CRA_a, partial [Olpidium bornovanus]
EGNSHQGVKGSRVVWLGDADRVATTGFSKTSDRQVFLWDTTNLTEPKKTVNLDTSSGVVMPFFDNDTKMLYLAGKGDGNIRYYEFENDDLFYLSEYKSTEPQRGMGWLPKRACNVADCEVARLYKVTNTYIEPISFTVPRKVSEIPLYVDCASDAFQADIYPHCPGDKPSLTAEEYFTGKIADPLLIDLAKGFVPSKPKEFVAPTSSAPEGAEALAAPKTEKEVGLFLGLCEGWG